MSSKKPFTKDILLLDKEEIASAVSLITRKMQKDVFRDLRRLGAVVGTSGGIDSSVCLALSAKAFGPDKVLAPYSA
jgi:NAD+ synthase